MLGLDGPSHPLPRVSSAKTGAELIPDWEKIRERESVLRWLLSFHPTPLPSKAI